MSLKAFHIVFILASISLCWGFGGWSLKHYLDAGERSDLVYAIVSIVAGFGLVVYGRAILKKLKNISYL